MVKLPAHFQLTTTTKWWKNEQRLILAENKLLLSLLPQTKQCGWKCYSLSFLGKKKCQRKAGTVPVKVLIPSAQPPPLMVSLKYLFHWKFSQNILEQSLWKCFRKTLNKHRVTKQQEDRIEGNMVSGGWLAAETKPLLNYGPVVPARNSPPRNL